MGVGASGSEGIVTGYDLIAKKDWIGFVREEVKDDSLAPADSCSIFTSSPAFVALIYGLSFSNNTKPISIALIKKAKSIPATIFKRGRSIIRYFQYSVFVGYQNYSKENVPITFPNTY